MQTTSSIAKKTVVSLGLCLTIGTNNFSMVNLGRILRSSQTKKIAACSLTGALVYKYGFAKTPAESLSEESDPRYKLFKNVQKINTIINALIGKKSEDAMAAKPFPYYGRTKDGLCLDLGSRGPEFLVTPWGPLLLPPSKRPWEEQVSFNVDFFQQGNFVFEKNRCADAPWYSDDSRARFYATDPTTKTETEITREQVRALQGTSAIIRSNFCGCNSLYKILALGGEKLPTPEIASNAPQHPSIKARLAEKGTQDYDAWLADAEKRDPSIRKYFADLVAQEMVARENATSEWEKFEKCYKNEK